MHKAICSDCGKSCELPFKPTGEKPVYCSDCFRGRGNDRPREFTDSGRRDFKGGDRGRSSDTDQKKNFYEINTKLDLILRKMEYANSENKIKVEHRDSNYEKSDKKDAIDTKELKKTIKKAIKKTKKVKKSPVKKKITKK